MPIGRPALRAAALSALVLAAGRAEAQSAHAHDSSHAHAEGARADLVVLDPELHPVHTIVGGETAWRS